MKIPLSPPDFKSLFDHIVKTSPEKLGEIFSSGIKPDPKGKYYHWDKLRHLKLPSTMSNHEEWWLAVKVARKALYKNIPHSDKDGNPFVFGEPDTVRRLLHEIDVDGGDELKTTEQVANPNTRDTYLINSLIEESITSSNLKAQQQLEK